MYISFIPKLTAICENFYSIELEMCQQNTDAPSQETSSPRNQHFARKMKVKKGHNSNNNWQVLS